jgi:hypothetical protein
MRGDRSGWSVRGSIEVLLLVGDDFYRVESIAMSRDDGEGHEASGLRESQADDCLLLPSNTAALLCFTWAH